jgi:hypothetical protein
MMEPLALDLTVHGEQYQSTLSELLLKAAAVESRLTQIADSKGASPTHKTLPRGFLRPCEMALRNGGGTVTSRACFF